MVDDHRVIGLLINLTPKHLDGESLKPIQPVQMFYFFSNLLYNINV